MHPLASPPLGFLTLNPAVPMAGYTSAAPTGLVLLVVPSLLSIVSAPLMSLSAGKMTSDSTSGCTSRASGSHSPNLSSVPHSVRYNPISMSSVARSGRERSHSFLTPSSFDPCRRCALCHPHPPRHKPHIKRRVIYAQSHHRLPPVHPTSHTTLKIHDPDACIPVCSHGTTTQLKISYRRSFLHYRAAFYPLVADPGRLDTASINTARSYPSSPFSVKVHEDSFRAFNTDTPSLDVEVTKDSLLKLYKAMFTMR
jgi:hypothetical protein